MKKKYIKALTVAGSDSGGGAGIQADLKTFSALGCFGMSVVTALTAQNTQAVTAIHPVPPEFIGQQLDAVLSDIGTDAVKIGMLHSPAVIQVVADKLKQWECPNIVLDPVMVSKSGDALLRPDAVAALKTLLIPAARLITPNLPEASALLDRPVTTLKEMEQAARDLAALGCDNVLVKGGHLAQNPGCDLLFLKEKNRLIPLTGQWVRTPNAHGTGCTLSSAIAAGLAAGLSLEKAVQKAKIYIFSALKAGAAYRIGHGHGPVHHFFDLWTKHRTG